MWKTNCFTRLNPRLLLQHQAFKIRRNIPRSKAISVFVVGVIPVTYCGGIVSQNINAERTFCLNILRKCGNSNARLVAEYAVAQISFGIDTISPCQYLILNVKLREIRRSDKAEEVAYILIVVDVAFVYLCLLFVGERHFSIRRQERLCRNILIIRRYTVYGTYKNFLGILECFVWWNRSNVEILRFADRR